MIVILPFSAFIVRHNCSLAKISSPSVGSSKNKICGSLKGKITIILTTHYLEEAEALSDYVCIMKDGKIKALGTTNELIKFAKTTSFEDAFIKLATGGTENENMGLC